MDRSGLSDLAGWITESGLAGKSETELVDGFCRRAIVAGLPIARSAVIIDTLHPVHEGRAVRWRRDAGDDAPEFLEYGSTNEGVAAESWRSSPFFSLLENGGSVLRRRLFAGEPADYPSIA